MEHVAHVEELHAPEQPLVAPCTGSLNGTAHARRDDDMSLPEDRPMSDSCFPGLQQKGSARFGKERTAMIARASGCRGTTISAALSFQVHMALLPVDRVGSSGTKLKLETGAQKGSLHLLQRFFTTGSYYLSIL